MTKTKKKKIFLVPRHETSWWQHLYQYNLLKKDFYPIIVLATNKTRVFKSYCIKKKINFVYLETKEIPSILNLKDFFLTIRILKRNYKFFFNLFNYTKPIAVLLPGDRELGPIPPILKATKELKIRTIITTTSSLLPSLDMVSWTRKNDKKFSIGITSFTSFFNLLVSFFFKNQLCDTKYGKLLFSPGTLILSLFLVGMLPKKPWCVGASKSDYIIAKGKKEISLMLKLGLKREKILDYGALEYDNLLNSINNKEDIKKKLNNSKNFSNNKKIILFSVPHNPEHNIITMDKQLEQLRIIFKTLNKIDENIILIFHPKTKLSYYKKLLKNYDFIISKESYIKLIPISDLYLCGNSTTVSVAEICNIPILNLDFVNLKFSWIKSKKLKNIINMNDLQLVLKQELSKIKKNGVKTSTLNQDYTIDGKSKEKFINFLHQII